MSFENEKDAPQKHFRDTIKVVNTPLLPTSYEELSDWVCSNGNCMPPCIIDFTNTHIVTLRALDPNFEKITNGVTLFVPDSTPLTWCVNLLGGKMEDRVYGPAFMNYCLKHSPSTVRHYFLGASKECLELLVANAKKLNPDLCIAGTHHGYFNEESEPAVVAEVNAATPDCIWIGLGTPKQQEFYFRNRGSFSSGILLLVGFAFDVNAGTKRDAPPLLQRLGLTWLFRMICEPKRLLPRYLKFNSLFLLFFTESLLSKLFNRAFGRCIALILPLYFLSLLFFVFSPISWSNRLLLIATFPFCAIGGFLSVVLAMTAFDRLGDEHRIPELTFLLNAEVSVLFALLAPILTISGLWIFGSEAAMTTTYVLLSGSWIGVLIATTLVISASAIMGFQKWLR